VAPSDIKGTLENLERVSNMELTEDNHHYLVLSHLYKWMQEQAWPAAKGVMLDYGCGGQPYRVFFEKKITKYIGADVAAAKNVALDVEFAPNQPVPLLDESIDTILANQTLEHVADANFYLSDCRRLLKPGGVLILTAPMQWRHHEVPFDYLRFTRYGLQHLLTKHGFEITNMTGSGGVYALLGQIFLNHLAERGIKRKRLFTWINRAALWLDRKFPDPDDTINWMCLAVKTSAQTRLDGATGSLHESASNVRLPKS
jgi:SAM-dependent methyltransferase